MAQFSMSEADNYSSGSGSSFFTLKDHMDKARVRFLYNTIDDVKGDAVHKVVVGKKQNGDPSERYVNCLRSYNEPLDKCPFCAAQLKVTPRLFLKLYNEDAGECQIWERSKSYFAKIAGLATRYNPLCNRIVEIERHGKSGDKETSYEFYPLDDSPVNLEDYECTEPLGTIILDKTFDEMNTFLDTGSFPEAGDNTSGNAVPTNQAPISRRTPSSNGVPSRRAF